jgi:hypothetical protein
VARELENREPMNALKAIWKWLVWFRYQSPVRNFGSDRLDDLRWAITSGMASVRGLRLRHRPLVLSDPIFWGHYTKCFLLAKLVELIDWLLRSINFSRRSGGVDQ